MAKDAKKADVKDDSWDETPAAPGLVKIKCIVETFPHTGIADEGSKGLGMRFKEVREVPEDIALLMAGLKQVEIL